MDLNLLFKPEEPEDADKGINYLKVAVLFARKILFAHPNSLYLYVKEELPCIKDPLERLYMLEGIIPNLNFVNADGALRNIRIMIDRLRRYRKYSRNAPKNLMWQFNKLFKKSLITYENDVLRVADNYMERNHLESLMELNRLESNPVVNFWLLKNPEVNRANREYMCKSIAEYRFLAGIFKNNEFPLVDRNDALMTSVYKKEFDINDFTDKLIISPDPLFHIFPCDMLPAEQIKITRQELSVALKDLKDLFDEFCPKESTGNSSTKQDFSPHEKELVEKLLENSTLLQQAVDESTYIKFLRGSGFNIKETGIYLGLCSKNTLIKLYRELGFLSAEVELFFRDMECRDVEFNRCCPVLVAGNR